MHFCVGVGEGVLTAEARGAQGYAKKYPAKPCVPGVPAVKRFLGTILES